MCVLCGYMSIYNISIWLLIHMYMECMLINLDDAVEWRFEHVTCINTCMFHRRNMFFQNFLNSWISKNLYLVMNKQLCGHRNHPYTKCWLFLLTDILFIQCPFPCLFESIEMSFWRLQYWTSCIGPLECSHYVWVLYSALRVGGYISDSLQDFEKVGYKYIFQYIKNDLFSRRI